jgi:hypothetical protein
MNTGRAVEGDDEILALGDRPSDAGPGRLPGAPAWMVWSVA